MEQFFIQHRAFTLSLLWLLTGLLFAGYSLFYQPLQDATKLLMPMIQDLEKQNSGLQAMIAQQENKEQEKAAGINNAAQFLARINELSSASQVVINKLIPEGEGKLRITLEINADFYTFLRFAAHLESLNVTLDNVEIHPFSYDPKKSDLPIHFISFTITPQNNAEPLAPGVGEALARQVKEAIEVHNLRNPFQRFAKDKSDKMEQLIDLTWVYKLGGFGTGPDGSTYAIIDNLEYRKGSALEGREVTEIDKASGRVMLEKRGEQTTKQRFVIKFRKKAGAGEGAKK